MHCTYGQLVTGCVILQYISGWLFEKNREQWGNRDIY